MIYKKISREFLKYYKIQHLYCQCFPPDERREWDKMMELIDNEPRFNVIAATSESDDTMGFISYWTFDSFTYVEHLAVDEAYRRQGIGAALLIKAQELGQPLVLEVEPPVDETTVKRVGFYRQLGLTLRDDIPYEQPPYSPDKEPVALCLMVSPMMLDKDIHTAIFTIRRKVFHAD